MKDLSKHLLGNVLHGNSFGGAPLEEIMVRHVNAVEARGRWAPLSGDSIRNCAACTAAGAVNLTLRHSAFSSGDVANARGKFDDKFTMGDDTLSQSFWIARYVTERTGRAAVPCTKRDLTSAENWMRSKPNNTVFAVLADGRVPHDDEDKCHWLNAVVWGGTIRYFDFQPMRASGNMAAGNFAGHANPATSTKPFVGVITQAQDQGHNTTAVRRQMQSSKQAGSFDESVKLTVIAFSP